MQYPVLLHRDSIGREFSLEAQGNSRNPWLRMAGMFKDDPALEEMLEEIYALRPAPESEK